MSKKSKKGRAIEEAAAAEIGGGTHLPGRGAMPKRRAMRRATPKSAGRGTLGKAILVAVVLCLTASGLTLAGLGRIGASNTAAPLGAGSPTASAPLTPAPVNFSLTSPSKEYIYTGGRLVATEEPAGLNPPGGLKFIQTKSTVSCGGKGTVWGYLTWNDASADETEFVIEERSQKTGVWNSWTALATSPTPRTSRTTRASRSSRLRTRDTSQGSSVPPNRVRDFTSSPANNSTFGTLAIRRTVYNNTGGNVTRLRFRLVSLTTWPAPAGTADLRALTSGDVQVQVPGVWRTVKGTMLEQPPDQPSTTTVLSRLKSQKGRASSCSRPTTTAV